MVVSTPFLIKVHELPMYGMHDYWRFTPRGPADAARGAGLEVEPVGSWGNRSAWSATSVAGPATGAGTRCANEPDIPVQVWAFARRPL